MCAYALKSDAPEIVVGTEVGILHRLKKENPDKKFWPVDECVICPDMKKATLEKVLACLKDMSPVVSVPESVAVPARKAIDAMLAVV
jgi:quinolinate synthase